MCDLYSIITNHAAIAAPVRLTGWVKTQSVLRPELSSASMFPQLSLEII
jgi:hypothetical protein